MAFNLLTFLFINIFIYFYYKAWKKSFFYLFYCFFVVVHDTSIKSFLTFFFFFSANCSVIVTKNFSQCCGWLRFATQPKLLFFLLWASRRLYCHNSNDNKKVYIEKISTFVLSGGLALDHPGATPEAFASCLHLYPNITKHG